MKSSKSDFSLITFIVMTFELYRSTLFFIIDSIKKYWFISFTLLLILGSSFYFKSKKITASYSASSSFIYNCLNKKVYGDLLYDIELLVNNSDYKAISKKLKISENSANSIIKFQALNLLGSPLHEDFSAMKVPFYINVVTKDKAVFPDIQNGIITFLLNDSFIYDYNSNRQLLNEVKLNNVINDITLVDSLLKKINIENTDKLEKLLNLRNIKQNDKVVFVKEVEKKNAVSVLKGFVPIKKSREFVFLSLLTKYLLMFFSLSIFSTVSLNWYNNIKDDF